MKKTITAILAAASLMAPAASLASSSAGLTFHHPNRDVFYDREYKQVQRVIRVVCKINGPYENAQACAQELHEANAILARWEGSAR